MTPAEAVGNRIRSMREAREMSQSALAAACCTSQMTVSRWERGVTTPGPARRVMIAQALDMEAQVGVLFHELIVAEASGVAS